MYRIEETLNVEAYLCMLKQRVRKVGWPTYARENPMWIKNLHDLKKSLTTKYREFSEELREIEQSFIDQYNVKNC